MLRSPSALPLQPLEDILEEDEEEEEEIDREAVIQELKVRVQEVNSIVPLLEC